MKFITGTGRCESEQLTKDYESAAVFGKIRVGTLGIYLPRGFSARYFGYGDFDRAFERVNEANGRCCCGSASFYYYRLVLVKDGKEIADWLTEEEQDVTGALAAVTAAAPQIAIGFVKPETAE